METSELDKAVAYTKQFIEAITPIAKKAYETGLVTLQIDAAQTLFINLLFLVASILVIRKVLQDYAVAKGKAELPEYRDSYNRCDAGHHLPGDGFLHFLGALVSSLIALISALSLIDVWVWVKLFSPQLWLMHQAVEKIVR